jgi:hypothetical protein
MDILFSWPVRREIPFPSTLHIFKRLIWNPVNIPFRKFLERKLWVNANDLNLIPKSLSYRNVWGNLNLGDVGVVNRDQRSTFGKSTDEETHTFSVSVSELRRIELVFPFLLEVVVSGTNKSIGKVVLDVITLPNSR